MTTPEQPSPAERREGKNKLIWDKENGELKQVPNTKWKIGEPEPKFLAIKEEEYLGQKERIKYLTAENEALKENLNSDLETKNYKAWYWHELCKKCSITCHKIQKENEALAAQQAALKSTLIQIKNIRDSNDKWGDFALLQFCIDWSTAALAERVEKGKGL